MSVNSFLREDVSLRNSFNFFFSCLFTFSIPLFFSISSIPFLWAESSLRRMSLNFSAISPFNSTPSFERTSCNSEVRSCAVDSVSCFGSTFCETLKALDFPTIIPRGLRPSSAIERRFLFKEDFRELRFFLFSLTCLEVILFSFSPAK